MGSNADEASLARAAPPDTDPAAYRADVERRFGTGAEEYLRPYTTRAWTARRVTADTPA